MRSRFERDLMGFHDLDAPPRSLQVEAIVRRQPMSAGRERGIRLVVGVLGLFWAIVLGMAVIAMLAAVGALFF